MINMYSTLINSLRCNLALQTSSKNLFTSVGSELFWPNVVHVLDKNRIMERPVLAFSKPRLNLSMIYNYVVSYDKQRQYLAT
jgi:hypothetical protein